MICVATLGLYIPPVNTGQAAVACDARLGPAEPRNEGDCHVRARSQGPKRKTIADDAVVWCGEARRCDLSLRGAAEALRGVGPLDEGLQGLPDGIGVHPLVVQSYPAQDV